MRSPISNVAFFLLFGLMMFNCRFEPQFDPDYLSCSVDQACPLGCVCSSVGICLPPDGRYPGMCSAEDPDCLGVVCKFGCRCEAGLCVLPGSQDSSYCADVSQPAPYEMEPDLIVTTEQDQLDSGTEDGNLSAAMANGLSLREALTLAEVLPGPHRIAFDPVSLGPEVIIQPEADADPWRVPSLTYLDGRNVNVTLEGVSSVNTGLLLRSTGVAISDLRLINFDGAAVRMNAGSADVHLFRLRIEGNGGTGIHVDGGEDIWIGRGRELAFEEPRNPLKNDLSQYDVNVIRSNGGDGIVFVESRRVHVYGSFVGFDTVPNNGSCGTTGNGGDGIRLEEVREAVIGAQYVTEGEYQSWVNYNAASGLDPENIFPSFVSVGCNRQCGMKVAGGGEIHMPGLILGNSAQMNPWGQNDLVNLDIQDTQGPVSYGPSPWMTDAETLLFGLIFYVDSLALQIANNQAEVTILGIQFVNLGNSSADATIRIASNDAPIRFWHLALTGSASQACIWMDSPSAEISILNSLFRRVNGSAPVLGGDVDLARLDLRSNLKFGIPAWLPSGVGTPDESNLDFDGDPFTACSCNLAIPFERTCQQVDKGLDLGLDRSPFPGENAVCAPDIGAFECVRQDCRAACQ